MGRTETTKAGGTSRQPSNGTPPKLLAFLIGLVLLSGTSSAAQKTPASAAIEPAAVPGVRIHAPEAAVVEGERIGIQLSGDPGDEPLVVLLRTSGDATLGDDFEVEGARFTPDSTLEVTLPGGTRSGELNLTAINDVAAEANEVLTLEIVPRSCCYRVDEAHPSVEITIARNDVVVTTNADAGEGSLRQAILNVMSLDLDEPITFDKEIGPFAEPQVVALESPLPPLKGRVVIDGRIPDRLWKAHGVTVSGKGARRVLEIAPDADVTLSALTIADGEAEEGAGILNRGHLVLTDSTLIRNNASGCGGAVLNDNAVLIVVNSTFFGNGAGGCGGAIASLGRRARVTITHATMSENASDKGGALYAKGRVLLRNSILANTIDGIDCFNRGRFDPESTHNLIESHRGCGGIVSTADPELEPLGGYNGPAETMPLGGGSPAINLGNNDASLDEHGERLVWDQRGNGDPRFVAGYADLGAFERQAFPVLTVDTTEDSGLRACTRAGPPDCSLRGAIELANVTEKPDTITFDSVIFENARSITLKSPLPEITSDLVIDARDVAPVLITQPDGATVRAAQGASLELLNVSQIESGHEGDHYFKH